MQEEIKTMARKWGNSIAVVIPNEIASKKNIKENTEVTLSIEKSRPKAAALWGFGKGRFKKSAQEIKDEIREEEWKKEK